MSSCIATIRLVHSGGYIQNCFSIHLKFCDSEYRVLCPVTKVLLNLAQFYSILAAINYFKLWKSAIMDQFVTFRKRVYNKGMNVVSYLTLSGPAFSVDRQARGA